MDDHRFDTLARSLSSRRSALGGLLGGGVAALLGVALPEEAEAHNFLARCRKIKNGPRRRACLRRARAHNRTHQCAPQALAITCAPGCGTRLNNCGQTVTCPCPPGRVCQNGGCVCPTGQEDSGGVCAVRPTCSFRGSAQCSIDPAQCCSNTGTCDATQPGNPFCPCCPCSASGKPCHTTNDCCAGTCIGFVCRA